VIDRTRLSSTSIDANVRFQVPATHRLRFTRDVWGDDRQVLIDLLESSDDRPAKVQVWIDEIVLDANGWLWDAIESFFAESSSRLVRAGSVQRVPGGEAVKNDIHILERMLKVMHAADLDRRSYVLVVGGGAVLDAVGFAASIAHRGIRLIRVPTTTLAQADSGVGVKNGVNLFGKKNWIGSFAVPWGVVNDARMLQSLSDRDYRCGFAEAVKVSLLKNPALFAHIELSTEALSRRDADVALPVIAQSARLHLAHITEGGDPFEEREARPLDFGHWAAHKLESLSNFHVRHGEAVAIGLAIDVVYSSIEHGLPRPACSRILRCLQNLGFETRLQREISPDDLLVGLEEFRQHLGGRLTVTMLEDIGKPIDVHEIRVDSMKRAIEQVIASSATHA
jgi:3-dehydroquinate synthase